AFSCLPSRFARETATDRARNTGRGAYCGIERHRCELTDRARVLSGCSLRLVELARVTLNKLLRIAIVREKLTGSSVGLVTHHLAGFVDAHATEQFYVARERREAYATLRKTNAAGLGNIDSCFAPCRLWH